MAEAKFLTKCLCCIGVLILFTVVISDYAFGKGTAAVNSISKGGVVKVNGKGVKAGIELSNGDEVEVIRGEVAVLFSDGSNLKLGKGNYTIFLESIRMKILEGKLEGTVKTEATFEVPGGIIKVKAGWCKLEVSESGAKIFADEIEKVEPFAGWLGYVGKEREVGEIYQEGEEIREVGEPGERIEKGVGLEEYIIEEEPAEPERVEGSPYVP